MLAGVDEAGRGPLAGPVVAAAVILSPSRPIAGLNDSKRLSARQRERLYEAILLHAEAQALGIASVEEIDRLNILQANLLAMQRAVLALRVSPSEILVDGLHVPKVACRARALIGGDGLEPAIMAASILAKVARDRMMDRLHAEYPVYGFDRHRGYGTAVHLAALREHGPCPAHRMSFRPVAMSLTR
jgi:ribonuclease HII